MRRRQTIFSLPGLILLAILLVGLSLVLWRQGGLAFSPGGLSAKTSAGVEMEGFTSHAEFERECSQCHQPLQSIQSDLCTRCHENVADQIGGATGLHGKIDGVSDCRRCHSDHRGRDFDLGRDALDQFDHSLATFSLIQHQIDYSMDLLNCTSCHLDDADFSFVSSTCTGCHGGHDREFMLEHLQDFGEDCLDCHDGIDRMADFDHNRTDFPLSGAHLTVSCVACHQGAQAFGDLPTECRSCHEEPSAHAGVFSEDCAACHNSQTWTPAHLDGELFDHTREAGFSLARHTQDFGGQAINCSTCHTEDIREFRLATCTGCHAENDQKFIKRHRDQFGGRCLVCHDGVDRMHDFDHASVFPLDGRHAEIECSACHVDKEFKGTSKACSDCHAEPEIHAGFFGIECQYCHTTTGWTPARLQNHTFPLDHGGQGEVKCQVCHPSIYSEYTCYGCHEHEQVQIEEEHREEGISMDELPKCVTCHPTGEED